MIVSDEIIGAAARAILTSRGFVFSSDLMEGEQDAYNASCDDAFEDARAAILAALPDIEKAVRGDCAAALEQRAATLTENYQTRPLLLAIATRIRALPPSTEPQS